MYHLVEVIVTEVLESEVEMRTETSQKLRPTLKIQILLFSLALSFLSTIGWPYLVCKLFQVLQANDSLYNTHKEIELKFSVVKLVIETNCQCLL